MAFSSQMNESMQASIQKTNFFCNTNQIMLWNVCNLLRSDTRLISYFSKKQRPRCASLRMPMTTTTTSEGDEEKLHATRGQKVASIVQKVIQEGIICDENPSIDLYSMTALESRLIDLKTAFEGIPTNVNHGLAVKANPIRGVLSFAQNMGFGAECASYPEVKHALSLGFEPAKIIYDSPCKTYSELKELIQLGIYINLDNEEEIEKVNRLIKDEGVLPSDKQIGLRINPVVGGGAIESSSTATLESKFGLPWTPDTNDKLIRIFQSNPWLQGVHVHIGSQGIALGTLIKGVQRAVEFATMVNERIGRKQVQVIDIGGGLPTLYDGINEAFAFSEYASALNNAVPLLFSGEFDLLTEFGRSVFVKPGITVTKVEAVKTWCDQRFAVVHVGANQFFRTAYLPEQWKHVMSVFSNNGKLKSGPLIPHDIVGPMCFQGDFLGRKVLLPEIETGDFLVIHDTGGYTTSLYSKFISRQANAMYGYDEVSNKMHVLKHKETCEETLAFWGLEHPVAM